MEETGNIEEAIEYLRKRFGPGCKKAHRTAKEGIITAYMHHNSKIGVLVELNCETDFVAKTDQFKELAKNIAMHIAWANPQYISVEDIPQEEIEKEKDVERERARAEGKPEAVLDKII